MFKEYKSEALNISTHSYISKSKIALVLDSPEAYWARYYAGFKKEATPAQERARMLHEAVLQPSEFAKNTQIMQFKDFRTKEAQNWRDEILKENPNAKILSKEKFEEVMRIVDTVRSHKVAGKLLAEAINERHGYATDEEFGLLYSRPDIHTKNGMIGDLKFIDSTNKEKFNRMQYQNNWYMQLAFYDHVDGLISGKKNSGNRFLLAVEEQFPHTTRIFAIGPKYEEMGEILWRKGASMIRELTSKGPGGEKSIWFADSGKIEELEPELYQLSRVPEFCHLIEIGG